MRDTVLLENGKSRYLRSVANFLSLYPTYQDFAAALIAGTLPVDFAGVNSAGCAQIGTSLNKANLLSDATAQALGLTSQDPTINEALAALSGKQDKITASGMLKGNGSGGVNAATAGTDYVSPADLEDAINRSTTVDAADTNYGTKMARAIYAGTSDMTEGSSSLTSGVVYLYYEA